MMNWIKNRRNIIAVAVIAALVLVLLISIKSIDDSAKKKKAEIEQNKISAANAEVEMQNYLDKSYEAASAAVLEKLPGIICWGDSLTAGMGGESVSYPSALSAEISNNFSSVYDLAGKIDSKYHYLLNKKNYNISIPVYNMGVSGEDVSTILGRSGAVPYILRYDITVPADTSKVEISIVSKNGNAVQPLLYGNAGLETVSIAGIEGKMTVAAVEGNYQYYFQRNEAGEATYVYNGTEIITAGSLMDKNMIPIVFMGASGGYLTPYDLMQKSYALARTYGERYIIVGIPTGTAESRAEMEFTMQNAFGDRYVNLREYLSGDAMADAGLTPTAADAELMAQGSVPISLRVSADNGHLNDTGYALVGRFIYQRMDELGYFDEAREALTNLN